MPIKEIDHPAITICSQGSIESLTEEAVKKQFANHIWKKHGIDILNDTFDGSKEVFWIEYLNDLYPGLKTSPAKIAKILRPSLDPNDYISTKTWIDPESVCTFDLEKEKCEYPWMALTNGLCFRNMGQGFGSEELCEDIGGQKISFDPDLWQNFEELFCAKTFGYEKSWNEVEVKYGKELDFYTNWGKDVLIVFEFTVLEKLHQYCEFPNGQCNYNIFEVSSF